MKRKLTKLTRNQYIVITLVLLAGFSGLAALLYTWRASIAEGQTVTFSTENPSEIKPDQSYKWRGKPTDPKRIIVESAGIDYYIQNVGTDQHGSIAVPNNIFIAGWYIESVLPGEKGLSIIDGHVNGRKVDDGVFKTLPRVQPNDRIVIEFGNSSRKTFQVASTKEMSVAESASVLFSQDPTISNQLNLITCAGSYDAKTRSYDKRFIVTAKLVE